MPVLPIDSGRYGTKEMVSIFEEETRLQKMLDVEAALCFALARTGLMPTRDSQKIQKIASTKHVKLRRVKEIESKIQHDVMAVVQALAEAAGESGSMIHFGATSNDINDTATTLQFKEAFSVLRSRFATLLQSLIELSMKHKKTLMIGRTHGQHALPITFGLKTSVWMMETSRHFERIVECENRNLVGKLTGAVGTQAGFGPKGLEVQRITMQRLGVKPVAVSTQIVQRDRYAEPILLLALIAASLEKFATEIRELQRSEIAEVREAFNPKLQVGSSTMPHKMNPMTSERICGLAKVLRGMVIPALEDVTYWNERDLTQSSTERFIIPTAFIILDYMLLLTNRVLSSLQVNASKMRDNMSLTDGAFMSESVMLALTRKGLARQEAHELVRKIAMSSFSEGKQFRNALLADKIVEKYLTKTEIDVALDPENYLGTTVTQIENAVRTARKQLSSFIGKSARNQRM